MQWTIEQFPTFSKEVLILGVRLKASHVRIAL